jgi:hypothetical protein
MWASKELVRAGRTVELGFYVDETLWYILKKFNLGQHCGTEGRT